MDYEPEWCLWKPGRWHVGVWLRRNAEGKIEGVNNPVGEVDPRWLYENRWYLLDDKDDQDYEDWSSALERHELGLKQNGITPMNEGVL